MEAELVRCPGCGAENEAVAEFCVECGRKLKVSKRVEEKR
jgi:predicted amidophosphoribosyltransferase